VVLCLVIIGLTLTSITLRKGLDNKSSELSVLREQKGDLDIEYQKKLAHIHGLQLEINRTNNFNYYYLEARLHGQAGDTGANIANTNYDTFMQLWSNSDFSNARELCMVIRDFFVSSVGSYQISIANYGVAMNYSDSKNSNEILSQQINVYRQGIELNWAKYEACEHYEFAINSYLVGSWDMGDGSVLNANRKIEYHDSLVTPYNEAVAKLKTMKERIKI